MALHQSLHGEVYVGAGLVTLISIFLDAKYRHIHPEDLDGNPVGHNSESASVIRVWRRHSFRPAADTLAFAAYVALLIDFLLKSTESPQGGGQANQRLVVGLSVAIVGLVVYAAYSALMKFLDIDVSGRKMERIESEEFNDCQAAIVYLEALRLGFTTMEHPKFVHISNTELDPKSRDVLLDNALLEQKRKIMSIHSSRLDKCKPMEQVYTTIAYGCSLLLWITGGILVFLG